MAKEKQYVQVHLKSGTTETKGYIETRGAKVGARVTLPESSKEDELWEVLAVIGEPVDESVIDGIQKNSRNHRKATDI